MARAGVLGLLFRFRKPGIINLSYIHVMVKDKPTLFIAWEVKHAWVVKIKSIRGRYYGSQQALIITAPAEQQAIVVKFANIWRSIEIILPMQLVQLDRSALAQLISGFKPMTDLSVDIPAPSKTSPAFQIKSSPLRNLIKPVEVLRRSDISIQPFNYP